MTLLACWLTLKFSLLALAFAQLARGKMTPFRMEDT